MLILCVGSRHASATDGPAEGDGSEVATAGADTGRKRVRGEREISQPDLKHEAIDHELSTEHAHACVKLLDAWHEGWQAGWETRRNTGNRGSLHPGGYCSA